MVKINGETWDVILVSPHHFQLQRSDGSYTLGVCDDIEKRIYINNSLSSHYIKRVLSHELTHAAMFSYNIELTYQQEELLADLIATYGQEIIDMTNKIFIRLKENREAY